MLLRDNANGASLIKCPNGKAIYVQRRECNEAKEQARKGEKNMRTLKFKGRQMNGREIGKMIELTSITMCILASIFAIAIIAIVWSV